MPFLVTDNGSSFIAKRFSKALPGQYAHVRIQYRTPTQLGLLERFHRTLKEKEVYWRLYDDPGHARACLAEFWVHSNCRRPHGTLVPEAGGDPWVPEEVYAGGWTIRIPKWQGWAKDAKEKLDALMSEEADGLVLAGAGLPVGISPTGCRRAGAFIAPLPSRLTSSLLASVWRFHPEGRLTQNRPEKSHSNPKPRQWTP